MSSRRDRATATRGAILDAAEHLFAAHGYDGTSTARLAEAAGVTKGLLFHYFASKSDILEAVLAERAVPHLLDDIDVGQINPEAPEGDLAAALVTLEDEIQRRLRPSAHVTQILIRESSTQPAARTRFLALCARIDSLVRATVDASLASRAIAEDRLIGVAQAFSATVFRSVTLERVTGAREDVARVARMCAAALRPPQPGVSAATQP